MATSLRAGGSGLVLARARGLEIVADPSHAVSLLVLTTFVGLPISSRVGSDRGLGYLLLGFAIAVACSACIVVHELAHTVTARILGHRVRRITLFALGGVSHVEGRPSGPHSEHLVALAGPLASLLIATPLVLIGRSIPASPFEALFAGLGLVNFLLGAFNLVPAFPLDGGRVLRSGLWAMLRDHRRATRAAAMLGRAFAALLIGVGTVTIVQSIGSVEGIGIGGFWQIMLGAFLFNAASEEERADAAADAQPGSADEHAGDGASS